MTGPLSWAAEPARAPRIPVSRPSLPAAPALLPYLTQIDRNRWYANAGPLYRDFCARLAAHFGATEVACGANATLGLTAALMAQDPAPGSLCMVPAWTFAATGHAVRLAGLEPWLVDVAPLTQSLTPALARQFLATAPGRVGAVVPVMPQGQPMPMAAWDAFAAETGLAVAIDAAAGFDTLRPARTPAVVSLHATKALGVGEGCCIVSHDPALVRRIGQVGNFGFDETREARIPALNAKLSEYGAAVGLAALDGWPDRRAALMRVAAAYRDGLANADGIRFPDGFGCSWVAGSVVVGVPALRATMAALEAAGIGFRRWWGAGLHGHAAFAACVRNDLAVTHWLAETQLGLPFYPDLPIAEVRGICDIVRRSARGQAAHLVDASTEPAGA